MIFTAYRLITDSDHLSQSLDSSDFLTTMPPSLRHLPLLSRDFDPGAPSAAFSREWSQPSNYAFTILLLLGGDVVSAAMGQLAGGLVTPVAFSFGMPLSDQGRLFCEKAADSF